MSVNRVVISGNLTRDPELRRTQSGMAILSFGVAVNDRRKNQQTGEWEDYANFVDCSTFGNRAESLGNVLHKGMKVAIEGKLRWSQWERDGQKRSKLEVIVDELEFMSQRQDGQGGNRQQGGGYGQGGYGAPQNTPQQGGYGYGQPQQAQGGYGYGQQPQRPAQQQPQQPAAAGLYDDDIPF